MQSDLQLKYFRGNEAESFTFYRIPKMLVKHERFKSISTESKFLYGIMLDRMSLSLKNNWIDSENRVFIYYKIENIMEDLQCGKEKASKLLKELDSKSGVGLIEKKRQGLGKPDIIYVKNFATIQYNNMEYMVDSMIHKDADAGVDNLVENEGKTISESGYMEMQNTDFRDSGMPFSELQDYGKSNTNNTEINNTEISDINPINQSYSQNRDIVPYTRSETDMIDTIDKSHSLHEEIVLLQDKEWSGCNNDNGSKLTGYAALIRDNIDYDHEINNLSYGDRELYESLYNIICDIMCNNYDTVRINRIDYPINVVRSKFIKLRSSHIYYVMEKINKTRTKISNIRNYLITALYNAPDTFEADLTAQVQYDLYGDHE